MSVFLFFTCCGANDGIDVCIRDSIRVDWINGINEVCWEVYVASGEEGVEDLYSGWVLMQGRST